MKKSKLIILYIAMLSVLVLFGACDSEDGDVSDNASDGNTVNSSMVESSGLASTGENSDSLLDDGMNAVSSDIDQGMSELSEIFDSSNNASSND